MSRGERQKPVTDKYRDNYDRTFGGAHKGKKRERTPGCWYGGEPTCPCESDGTYVCREAKPTKARKGEKAKPTQPHRDRTQYYRPDGKRWVEE